MMKKSKKGVTLVELVICCAIIVMLGGACTAVLMSGEHVYSTSSHSANAQLDADVLQTYMMNLLPSTGQVSQLSGSSPTIPTTGNCMYFNEGVFTLRRNGEDTTIRAVSGFTYTLERAGTSASARAQFVYTATMNDGSTFSGGFIMNNMTYDAALKALVGEGNPVAVWKLEEHPFCFDVASEEDVTEPTSPTT